jgi:hypothetical protein
VTLAFLMAGAGRERLASLAGHGVAQLGVWTALKVWLHSTYAGNPGPGLLEMAEQVGGRSHLLVNLEYLASPRHWPYLFGFFGFLWIPCVFGFRGIRHTYAQRTLLVALPYLGAAMIAGNVYEFRMFGELAPAVLVGAYLSIGTWVGLRGGPDL